MELREKNSETKIKTDQELFKRQFQHSIDKTEKYKIDEFLTQINFDLKDKKRHFLIKSEEIQKLNNFNFSLKSNAKFFYIHLCLVFLNFII